MDVARKIKLFFSLDHYTRLLLMEAYCFLGWARYLKGLPFVKISPSLGEPMNETNQSCNRKDIDAIRSISEAVFIMSRHTWWESQCLVMAIAAMKMLERRHIESTLYMGIARECNGDMSAHAWLRSGSYYVSGAVGMERFTVVATFAKRMNGKKM